MIAIVEEPIPVEIYQKLRVDSGLSAKSDEAARIGLTNTLFSVVAKDKDGTYVGMGRVIGDGGCFCQVVDICVLPHHQGMGIGKGIMTKISDFIEEQLPETCYISLLADGDADILYKQFGFQDAWPLSKGMFLKK